MKVWIRMAIFQVSSQQFMHVNCTYNMQVDGMTCFLFHGRVYLRSNYLYERIHIFSFLAGRPFPRLKFAFKIEIHIFYFLLWNKKMSVRQVFLLLFLLLLLVVSSLHNFVQSLKTSPASASAADWLARRGQCCKTSLMLSWFVHCVVMNPLTRTSCLLW